MPFPSAALSAANLVKLRGDATTYPRYAAAQYISLCANTTILACRVNGTPTGASFAQFNFDTVTVGAYSSVRQDMTVLVSHTDDRRAAFFIGRARVAPTSTIIYVNETSAAITDNDYVFIIDDFRIWDKLPREVSGVQYKDYDIAFRALLPVIKGLQTAYAGWCNASNVLRLTLDASTSYGATSGATISTYSWIVPAGTTYISGSSSTAAITIDVPHSAGDWIHLTVTDSGSRVSVRHIFVHAASTTYPPALGFSGAEWEGEWESGWNATIEGFAGISDALDHTFCVLWVQEWYNDIEGSIVNAVDFVGRLRQEAIETRADETYSAVQTVRYQIEGPAAQLARIEAPKLALRLAASPDEWDEIADLTIWRAIVHVLEHSTFLNLHDLAFHSTDNTFLYPQLGVQGGDLFRCGDDTGESINAYLEFTPQGEARVMRSAWHLTTAERNALVTHANWTTQDALDLAINTDPAITVGKVAAAGGYYDSTAGVETPLLALAPGVAQDIGTEEPQLTRQILAATSSQSTAQAELNTRAGNELEFRRGPNTLTVLHPDGYHLLIPSRACWYTWTIAATDNARGVAYTTATRWLVQRVSVAHNNDQGRRDISATYIEETTGTAGQTVQYPSSSEITPALPEIPPFDAYFSFPELPQLYYDDTPIVTDIVPSLDTGALTRNGSVVIACGDDTGGDSRAIITKQFLLSANPPWLDITPDDDDIVAINHCSLDPFPSATGKIGAYLLCDDGASSFVYYAPDVAANPPGWILGTAYAGIYKVLRVTSADGGILIYAPGGEVTASYSFIASEDGWTLPGGDPALGVYVAGSGWHDNFVALTQDAITILSPSFSSRVVTTVVVTFSTIWTGTNPHIRIMSADLGTVHADSTESGSTTIVVTVPNVTLTELVVNADPKLGDFEAYAGYITAITIISGNTNVRYSSDHGSTFGSALAVGTSPGAIGGFDTQNGGTVSLAARDQQVEIATTLGGAYSDETNGAVASAQAYTVIIPWYDLGSSTVRNTGSTPDYLLGSSALVGGEALFKVVNGVGQTAITPSSGGTKALAVGPDGLTIYKGTHIAYLGNVSGTTKLFTSTNTGGSWTERENVSSTFILLPRRRSSVGPLYWVSGGNIRFSPNWGVTRVSKTTPLASVTALDIYS